jgi:hypothetical protein
METHVKVVAVLNIIFGGLGLLGAAVVLLVFGGAAGLVRSQPGIEPEAGLAAGIVGLVGGAIFLVVLVLSLPCLLGGIGLLRRREWARILVIVLSALNLLNIPIGTVIGAYSLWVLLARETQPLFAKPSA